MSEACSISLRLSLAGLLTALMAATILSSTGTNGVIASQADGQRQPLVVEESFKTLGTTINGNVFEMGKRNAAGKYEIYKYEGFHTDNCSIGWRETHEIYDAGQRSLREVQDVTAPLPIISSASVESTKISSGYLVSFTTQELKPGINARVRSTYADGSETEAGSIATGYGFYFSDVLVAKKVAKALFSAIRSCSKARRT